MGIFPFPGQRLGWMRDLLHEERYSSIRLWGLSLNFTLEEMVHPYVMVHFCVYIYIHINIYFFYFSLIETLLMCPHHSSSFTRSLMLCLEVWRKIRVEGKG